MQATTPQPQMYEYDCKCDTYQGCSSEDGTYTNMISQPTSATGEQLTSELVAECTTKCNSECDTSTFVDRNGISVNSIEEALGVANEKIKPWERWGFFGPPIRLSKQDSVATFSVLAVYLLLGVWAASKSWKFNTRIGKINPLHKTSVVGKIVYSLVALFFGPLYILCAEVSQRSTLLTLLEG